jgi:hypothetical protein
MDNLNEELDNEHEMTEKEMAALKFFLLIKSYVISTQNPYSFIRCHQVNL